jgi:hypothetical protein
LLPAPLTDPDLRLSRIRLLPSFNPWRAPILRLLSEWLSASTTERLQPDTSPHALRIPDRSGHPALWYSCNRHQVRLGCIRLSPSCPFRLLHTALLSRPARHYPRFRIRRSSSERRGDFNPPDSRAAQHTLRLDPPPCFPAYGSGHPSPKAPAGNHPAVETGLPGFQRDPCLRDVAIDPGRVEKPCDSGSSHMAFDSRHGLGLRDLTNYVAHSLRPRRYRTHPQHSLSGDSLGPTRAGPSPAGLR